MDTSIQGGTRSSGGSSFKMALNLYILGPVWSGMYSVSSYPGLR